MNILRRFSFIALFVFALSVGLAYGQASPTSTPAKAPVTERFLTIQNEAGQITKLGVADLAKLKRLTVKVSDHGTEAVFEGVALVEVLKLGGVEFGEKLRGKRLATYLLVEAADNYRAVFALPELDPGFTDRVIILADKRDGKVLPANAGDWQIVTPDEKRAGALGAPGC